MRGKCWTCGAESTLTQVRGCVYADPCGHRWRGRLEEPPPLPAAPVRRLLPRVTTELDPRTGLKRIVRA